MKSRVKLSKQKRIDTSLGNLVNLGIIISKGLKKKRINKNPNKILIYKLDAIGDSILCLPMIKFLKEKTKAKIIVACSKGNYSVFQGQKFIDKILLFDSSKLNFKNIRENINILKREKIDVAIDGGQTSNISAIFSYLTSRSSIGFKKIKGKTRNKVYDFAIYLDPQKHMIDNYISLLNPLEIKKKNPKLLKLKYSKKDDEKIKKLIKRRKNLVGLHLWDMLPHKKWVDKELIKLIEYLAVKKYSIILVGSKEESFLTSETLKKINKKYLKNILNLSGEINIGELIALISKLKLFIALDGGPMHIASAMKTPVIGLFGHENPIRYKPLSKNIVIYKNTTCSPCAKPYENKEPTCKNPLCLKNISFEDLKKAIKDLEK